MSAAKLLFSGLTSLGLLALSAGASAQPKKAPPPELPPSTAAPDSASAAADAPATSPDADKDVAPGPVRALEADRGAVKKDGQAKALAQPPPAGAGEAPATIEIDPAAPAPEQPDPKPAGPPHKQRFSVGLGFRGGVVSDPGYDPYSTNNALPMASVQGTFTPWLTRPVAFSLVAEWDYGGSYATVRGNQASMNVHRLALDLESRYMPITRMAFFARVVPSAMRVGASIDDAYLGNKLEASSWTWGVDVTGGAAARVGAVGTNENPLVSFWLALDMGYRFAGPASMRLRPGDLTEEDQTRKFGEIPMTDLDLSGFIGRLSFSVGF